MISRRRNGDTNTVCNPSLGIGIPNSSHQLSESPHVSAGFRENNEDCIKPFRFSGVHETKIIKSGG